MKYNFNEHIDRKITTQQNGKRWEKNLFQMIYGLCG